MDYGPSLAFFEQNMFYFKRVIKQMQFTVLQLYKYNFSNDSEEAVEAIQFREQPD